MKNKYKWSIVGGVLSFGSPFGLWVLLHLFLHYETSEIPNASYYYTGFGTFVVFSLFGYFLGKLLDDVEFLASYDGLTGLYRRRVMLEYLNNNFSVSKRYKQNFTLIMLDIDHFKKVNDSYGHPAGDRVLVLLSEVLRKTCRHSDLISRWGGEEFIVQCPETSKESGIQLAERIRKNVAAISDELLGFKGPVTVSLGIVSEIPTNDEHFESFIKEVDIALYNAKNTGRNKWVVR